MHWSQGWSMESLVPLLQQHVRKGFIRLRCGECWSCVTYTARFFWYEKSSTWLLGGSLKPFYFRFLFRSWYLVLTANVCLFTYRLLIEGLAGNKSMCQKIRCLACFIVLYHLEEILPCDLYLVPSSLSFNVFIRKNLFHSQTSTVCLNKTP